jgi:hypothetical protein
MTATDPTRRRRWIYVGASIAIHLGLLAIVFASWQRTPTYHEIPISFSEPPAVEAMSEPAEEPAATPEEAGAPGSAAAHAEDAATATSQSAANQSAASETATSKTATSEPASHQRNDELLARLAADLSTLRTSLMVPAADAGAASDHAGDGGPAPADPDIHLSEAAIARLVSQRGSSRGDDGVGVGVVQIGIGATGCR